MRILYVINSLNIGGAEKLCVELIKLALDKNIKIDIYVLNNCDSTFKKELEDININIFNCGTNNYKSLSHLNWLLRNKKNYDVIHSHLSYSQYYVALIRLFDKKIKLITTEHNTFNERRKYKIFKFIEQYMYEAYDKVAVINEANKKAIIKWQRNIRDKIVVIENGINLNKFINGNAGNINDSILKDNSKKKILMVAAFREQKNHKLMIDAMKDISEDKILILVGDGNKYEKKKLEKQVEYNDLKSRVIFLGNRTDVENIMKCCDLFVLPSLWEGFGLVAAEAMASGLPIIASNVEGLSQVVDGVGVLFENNNKKDLVDKINLFFSKDEMEKKEIIKKGIRKSKKYTIDRTLDKYMYIYSN